MTNSQLNRLFAFLLVKILIFAGISWYAQKQLRQMDDIQLEAAGLTRDRRGRVIRK